jgi:hypothetical protein
LRCEYRRWAWRLFTTAFRTLMGLSDFWHLSASAGASTVLTHGAEVRSDGKEPHSLYTQPLSRHAKLVTADPAAGQNSMGSRSAVTVSAARRSIKLNRGAWSVTADLMAVSGRDASP